MLRFLKCQILLYNKGRPDLLKLATSRSKIKAQYCAVPRIRKATARVFPFRSSAPRIQICMRAANVRVLPVWSSAPYTQFVCEPKSVVSIL
jgi:hypothetical protein